MSYLCAFWRGGQLFAQRIISDDGTNASLGTFLVLPEDPDYSTLVALATNL